MSTQALARPTRPGWKVCPRCPEDDNEWPASEFYKGFSYCKACYAERYPRKRATAESVVSP
jgi:hypothetical protein